MYVYDEYRERGARCECEVNGRSVERSDDGIGGTQKKNAKEGRKEARKEGRKEGGREANEANLYVEHDVSKDGAAWEHEGGLAGKLHNRPGDHLVVHHVHLAAVAHHFGLLLGHRHDVQVY